MTKNYKILAEFIKDMSCETQDVETFLFVKDNIAKYSLHIDIKSRPLKNKIVEINTILKFEDKNLENKRSYFEILAALLHPTHKPLFNSEYVYLISFDFTKSNVPSVPSLICTIIS